MVEGGVCFRAVFISVPVIFYPSFSQFSHESWKKFFAIAYLPLYRVIRWPEEVQIPNVIGSRGGTIS